MSKRSQIKNTCLIIVEGPDDQAFFTYLKYLFLIKNKSYYVKIAPAHGGGISTIIDKTVTYGGRNTKHLLKICFVDEDKKDEIESYFNNKLNKSDREIIKSHNIKLALACPVRLEGLLHKIHNINNSSTPRLRTADQKKWFNEIIPEDKQGNWEEYKNHFSKDDIKKTAENDKNLELVIKVLSGEVFKKGLKKPLYKELSTLYYQ